MPILIVNGGQINGVSSHNTYFIIHNMRKRSRLEYDMINFDVRCVVYAGVLDRVYPRLNWESLSRA
jgi:hypothetical protein